MFHFSPLFPYFPPNSARLVQLLSLLVQVFTPSVPVFVPRFSLMAYRFFGPWYKNTDFFSKGCVCFRPHPTRTLHSAPHIAAPEYTPYTEYYCIFVPIYTYICNRPCAAWIFASKIWYKNWYNLVQKFSKLYHACPHILDLSTENRTRVRF